MSFRDRVFALLCASFMLATGYVAASVLNLATAGNAGTLGGPPHYLIPSIFIGCGLGFLLAGLIAYATRSLGDNTFLLISLAAFGLMLLTGSLGSSFVA